MINILITALLIVFLATLALWAMRGPSRAHDFRTLPVVEVWHHTYLPVMRQILSCEDLTYLRLRAPKSVTSRALRERRQVVLSYLQALRAEFTKLLALARVAALLSPEIDARHEIQRLRLTMQFGWRFQLVTWRVRFNFASLPAIASLGEMVSVLNIRLEAAIKELSERAALAGEIASSLDRRGLDSIG